MAMKYGGRYVGWFECVNWVKIEELTDENLEISTCEKHHFPSPSRTEYITVCNFRLRLEVSHYPENVDEL